MKLFQKRIPETNLDKFTCEVFYKLLINREEKRFLAFVKVYTSEILNADAPAVNFGPDEVIAGIKNIGNAFPDETYWRYAIHDNCVLIFRKDENDCVCKITVKKTVSK